MAKRYTTHRGTKPHDPTLELVQRRCLLRGKHSSVLGALRVGESAIRNPLRDQLGMLKADTREVPDDYPTPIAEIGVPFDMDAKKPYGFDGNSKYTDQTRSLNGADGKKRDQLDDMDVLALWSMDAANLDREERVDARNDPAHMLNSRSFDSCWDLVRQAVRFRGRRCERGWNAGEALAGTLTYIDFDISKALLEPKIKVTTNDRPWGGKTPIRSSLSGMGEDEEELSTEIYIPPGALRRRPGDDDDATVVVHMRQESKPSVDSSVPVERRRTTPCRARAYTTGTLIPILPTPSSEPAATSPAMLPIPLAAQSIIDTLVESEMLAHEVEASEGKWELDRQVLRWWYEVPEKANKS
ncbi:hypothetical protein RSOLAG22IIIB_08623 [Rhizoctonia solani]|uniref:Uncharacterized protein n=1 Tax=Rhizoctonia solani TaxID=456999 RepID=A0A0K6FUG8_9AGAM|nr:hypothetical protein RSOLAG22IIIB_08623 [Rhizoctonia solani]